MVENILDAKNMTISCLVTIQDVHRTIQLAFHHDGVSDIGHEEGYNRN